MKRMFQDIKQLMAVALFAVLLLPMVAEAALSGQAGNTIIRNTVSVAYSDAGGNAQAAVQDSLDVTVITVDALPSIVSISPASGISTKSTGDAYTYVVTVRTNSNGPGGISLSAADVATTPAELNVSGTIPTIPNVFLGSTTFDPTDANAVANVSVTVAAAGTITIKVPNDGGIPTDAATTGGGGPTVSDGVINALAVNDIVYITDGGAFFGPFTLTAVTDPVVGGGVTAAPGTLVLTNNTAGGITFTPAAGWMIVESKQANLVVTQGALANPAVSSTWKTTITLTMGGAGPTASATTVTTTATAGSLSVVKYVRNVTNANAGAGGKVITVNGAANTYYTSGVGAKPTEILEYAVQITNNGAANATVAIATDNVPAYTTLVAGTAFGIVGAGNATDIFAVADDGSVTNINLTMQATDSEAITLASGGSAGITAGSAMTLYVGTANTNSTGGTIASAAVYTIIYRVKVD